MSRCTRAGRSALVIPDRRLPRRTFGRRRMGIVLLLGGYCDHGNVLLPTWHRVYPLKLEEALQSIPGCEQLMLSY
ncbi:tyrosinase family protein [Burkholderia ubonensis]|uniref:tyrosinase family protein n=1 Tax=Burkholderia ubonensis TaxID=101571 RepID=UPI0009B4D2A0